VEEFNGLVSNGVNSNVGPFTYPEELQNNRIFRLFFGHTGQEEPDTSGLLFLQSAIWPGAFIFNL
jgi:hypothetical protein